MDCAGESCGAAAGVENAQRARIKSHVLGGYLKIKKIWAEKEWEFGNSFIRSLGQRVNEQEGGRMQAKGEVAAVVRPSRSGWAFHIKAGFGGEARISQV